MSGESPGGEIIESNRSITKNKMLNNYAEYIKKEINDKIIENDKFKS